MGASNHKNNALEKVSIQALFKELKKRQGVECLVIDEDYVLKIKKEDVDILCQKKI